MNNPTIDRTDELYCPAQPMIDLRTGDRVGWWYGVHIIPPTYKEPTCWRCGVVLDPGGSDTNTVIENIVSTTKEK